jgi:predicted phosphodiesterase
MESYAIINDVHFPYEDKTRYSVCLDIMKEIGPTHLFLNGDIGEIQSFSHWPIHPTEKGIGLIAEIEYMNKKFDELVATFPSTKVTYLCGNHEDRLFRYIRDIAPHMWGIVPDCPELLKFKERPGWKFVPYGPTQLIRCGKANLYLRHEPIGRGVSHAKTTAEASVVDIAYGHTHTYQSYTSRKFGPTPVINKAYYLGWLGDKSRKCFDYRGSKDNWTIGFTAIDCDEKTGNYSLDFICLDRLPVFYKGKAYGKKRR